MENNDKKVMTVDGLCETLNISQNLAYQLLKTGQIPCFKIGRVWKIPTQGVDDFIKKQAESNAVVNLKTPPPYTFKETVK
jgi:excisionase family DNA binding protein